MVTGAATSIGTVTRDNYDANTAPLGSQWDGLTFPPSLNRCVRLP